MNLVVYRVVLQLVIRSSSFQRFRLYYSAGGQKTLDPGLPTFNSGIGILHTFAVGGFSRVSRLGELRKCMIVSASGRERRRSLVIIVGFVSDLSGFDVGVNFFGLLGSGVGIGFAI